MSFSSTGMPDASRVFSTFTNPLETQSTVIIGAGIVGLSTAYYLAHSGHTKPDTIHLIESSPELFASASGKAAGFCAPDCWSTLLYSIRSLLTTIRRVCARSGIIGRTVFPTTQRASRSTRWAEELGIYSKHGHTVQTRPEVAGQERKLAERRWKQGASCCSGQPAGRRCRADMVDEARRR